VTDELVDDAEPRGSFAQGIAIGLAVAALAIHLVMSAVNAPFADMYRDLGTFSLPFLTRLTLSIGWKIGVGGIGGAALATLIVRRPRNTALYALVAVALAIAATMTWWYPSAPIGELAGTIK
jgi:hypothetical protein